MRAAILTLALAVLSPGAAADGITFSDPEDVLLGAIDRFMAGDIDAALDRVRPLAAARPDYRLAQLVYGDLLAARAGAPLSVDAASDLPRTEVDLLLAEARQRLRRRSFPTDDRIPEVLLRFGESQRHALFVDLAQSRLFVFENRDGRPALLGDYYVSGGRNGTRKQREGDRRTPLGVYFVTERLPGERLPDRYGPVAFPVSYPNAWDRMNDRTGSGIWLHGVSSDTYSRPPQDSDGCVALSNDQLLEIAPLMDIGNTPVVIGENVTWELPGTITEQRRRIEDAVETWREDWESGDVDRYLRHYDENFSDGKIGKAGWASHKRGVFAGKKWMQVGLSDVSIFAYPEEPDLFVVSFRQEFKSNNFNGLTRKRQYWRRSEDGGMRIVFEGLTRGPVRRAAPASLAASGSLSE